MIAHGGGRLVPETLSVIRRHAASIACDVVSGRVLPGGYIKLMVRASAVITNVTHLFLNVVAAAAAAGVVVVV